jgi:hypothetical protein
MNKSLICPGCGGYIGMYNREGKLVACEWHNTRIHEKVTPEDPGRVIARWNVKRQWICDRYRRN